MDEDESVTLERFTRAERFVHRTTSALMIVCIGTAAVLYNGDLAIRVGHRRTVELIHVYCGFSLPIPMLVGLAFRAYRADLGRLNRFVRADWQWLRSGQRRDGTIRVGKFNAGQKLNAALSAAAILVLFGTGTLMYFTGLARLSWRTGATFVHDWFALAVGLLVFGHLALAVADREARAGMRTGRVLRSWARAQHEGWVEELSAGEPSSEGNGPAF